MTGTRLGLGVAGVLVGGYGAYLLLWDRLDQLLGTVIWAGGGVVVHDFALVPLTLLLLAGLGRLVPAPWRAPAGVGLVVLGTVSVVAVPFLGRFGELADNPTLLDRDYSLGYAVLVAVVVVGVVLGTLLLRARDRRRPEDLSAALDAEPATVRDDTPER